VSQTQAGCAFVLGTPRFSVPFDRSRRPEEVVDRQQRMRFAAAAFVLSRSVVATIELPPTRRMSTKGATG
jgi:hypothetical protein